jgi:NADH-quinone oxidoreductase subunit C
MAAGEYAKLVEAGLAVQLPERLARLRDHIVGAFDGLEVLGFRGELTLIARAEQLGELLQFCRDDPGVRCELLADLSAVHWLRGKRVEAAQETTGWPAYEFGDDRGRIELDYILYSITHNHRLRIRVDLPDVEPHVASATQVYDSANFMERETYDFFGVIFDGHPNLTRILMPEDWVGHPQRKDYPLGGVEVRYHGATIPPPDERSY